jgi:uncharacterized protein
MSDWDRNATRWGQYPAQARGAAVDQGLRAFMLGVYNNMLVGLVVTGITALIVSQLAVTKDPDQAVAHIRNLQLTPFGQAIYFSPLRFVVMFAPLAFVFFFQFSIQRIAASTARLLFFGFSALMGLSISSILLVYTQTSIANAFFITAASFGALSLYGYTTKRDLSPVGAFMMMGLVGLILVSIANMFIGSAGLGFALSCLIVLVFAGLTAYDTQNIRQTYYQVSGNGEAAARMSVIGALQLYLDFINIFLAILRLTGSARD